MPDRVPPESRGERDGALLGDGDAPSPARDTRLRGLSILIVEDEFLIAAEICAALKECGAKIVGPAATVQHALTLADGDVSCGILDVRLGRHSVGPVAEMLTRRKIPFLFYSAQSPTAPFLKDWPKITLLEKPAAPPTIVAALHSLMSRSMAH